MGQKCGKKVKNRSKMGLKWVKNGSKKGQKRVKKGSLKRLKKGKNFESFFDENKTKTDLKRN